ncbi:hypothetical protein [Thiobacillus sp.]|nr:hypothetical protein [Thiobacillus sp.]
MEWLAESGLKAKWRIAFGKHKGEISSLPPFVKERSDPLTRKA